MVSLQKEEDWETYWDGSGKSTAAESTVIHEEGKKVFIDENKSNIVKEEGTSVVTDSDSDRIVHAEGVSLARDSDLVRELILRRDENWENYWDFVSPTQKKTEDWETYWDSTSTSIQKNEDWENYSSLN